MTSYRQLFYHVIFHTKNSENTITEENCKEAYNYIWGIMKNKNSKLYQINGVENHIHLLVDIHPSIAIADFLRDLKSFSSSWMKKSSFFKNFRGWADGYTCMTISFKEKDRIIRYIKNQKEHHKKESFYDEYRRLLLEEGIKIDERYFLK